MQFDTNSFLIGAAAVGAMDGIWRTIKSRIKRRAQQPWLRPLKSKAEFIQLPPAVSPPSIKVQPRYGQIKRTAQHPGDFNFNFNESHK